MSWPGWIWPPGGLRCRIGWHAWAFLNMPPFERHETIVCGRCGKRDIYDDLAGVLGHQPPWRRWRPKPPRLPRAKVRP